MARDAHSAPRGARLAHRHLRHFPAARIFHQHAFAFRPRARHRPRCRRRHRGGRSGRAPHRAGHEPARGHAQGHAGSLRSGRGHRPRSFLRLHSDHLHPRNHRQSLPAIRRDHCGVGLSLGFQRIDSQSGHRRAHPAPERRDTRAARRVLQVVQQHVRQGHERLRAHLRRRHPQAGPQPRLPRHPHRRRPFLRRSSRTVLPPRRRPRIFLRRTAAAQCFLHGTHRRGGFAGREDPHGNTRCGIRDHRGRLQPAQPGLHDLQFIFLRHAQTVGRTHHAADAIQQHHPPGERPTGRTPVRHGLRLFAARHSRRRHLGRRELCSAGPFGRHGRFPRRANPDLHGRRGQAPRVAEHQHDVSAFRPAAQTFGRSRQSARRRRGHQ